MNRAFTLVELIVVIAIIGILAAVILSKLNDARDLGIDSKTKAEINLISKRGSILYNEDGHYNEVCGSNSFTQSGEIADLIVAIESRAGGSVVCNSDLSLYAVSAPLLEAGNWCIDSTGASHEIALPLGAGVLACPGA